MNIAQTYRNQISALANEISGHNNRAVIVGAGRGGWYLAQAMAHHGVEVSTYADSDSGKHGFRNGKEILSIPSAIAKYPDAIFLPGVLNSGNLPAMQQMLRDAGAADVRYFMPQAVFCYFTEIKARNCNPSALAESFGKLYGDAGKTLVCSPSLSYVITQKCTLNCKDCGAFVPENAKPATFPASAIVEDIRKYCSAFDIVHHIALQGGEPFLHREIASIVEQISAIPNLLFVDIVTNGTIVPKPDVLETISRNGVCVIISDYGAASPKIAPLTEACKKSGIYVGYYNYVGDAWGSQYPMRKRNRNTEANDAIFRYCVSNPMVCGQIMDGKFHRCSFSNFTEYLRLTPELEGDFVNLAALEFGDATLAQKIRAIALRGTALAACDYCPGNERSFVPAGIQIPRIRRTKK